jgi:hypothetical protein
MGAQTREHTSALQRRFRTADCKPATRPAQCARSAVAENQPVHHEQNRMSESFANFAARLREFIALTRRLDSTLAIEAEESFQELAVDLFPLQFERNAAYRKWCEDRGVNPAKVSSWKEIPAVPASAFKELELTSLPPSERTRVFLSSGTTAQKRSRHFHSAESLAIYEAALLPWFERHFLSDINDLVEEQLLGPLDKFPFLALTPPPSAAPNSSLVHMFECVRREFGARDSLFAGRGGKGGAWTLDIDAALFAIRKSMCANRPLALLGTAFNFVHLLDHFAANNMRYRLARGSRVLETGGYKGQSREISRTELHALITRHLGIAPEYIVTEYGMSELSSQAYDRIACSRPQVPKSQGFQVFRFPLWARAQVVSPETGREVAEGETGLLRIFDLANVRSVMAIQTEDLAVRHGDEFELLGRVPQSEARGCSLMSLNVER